MDAATFCKAMNSGGHTAEYFSNANTISIDNYVNYNASKFMSALNAALILAKCTTVKRAAMAMAQVGAETGSCHWNAEIDDGSAYNWRVDLGNIFPGDGPKFKGRGMIQLTGRSNYRAFSKWAYALGLTKTKNLFIKRPDLVATEAWEWYAFVFFWSKPHARNTTKWKYLNDAADHSDVSGATWIINGGQTDEGGRESRWNHCLPLGDALLPEDDLNEQQTDARIIMHLQALVDGKPRGSITQKTHPVLLGWGKRVQAEIHTLNTKITALQGKVQALTKKGS